MVKHAVRFVGGPLGRFFRKRKWAGVTLPVPGWGALVIIWTANGMDWDQEELRHEVLGHVPQIARLGAFRYVVTILWQYARFGHRNATLEIEARKAAGQE
jgi:hypothetical protein